jgi:chromate transporter
MGIMNETVGKSMKKYIQLYVVFLRLGAFTFGGGLAMLPLLRKEIVVTRNWIKEEDLIDMYAVAQCAPGIIAINTATYVGYAISGIVGSLIAVLGQIASPMIVITLIAAFFQHIMDSVIFQHFLAGIGAMVCVLLSNTVWAMGKKSIKDTFTAGLCSIAFLLGLLLNIPTIALTLGSGIISVMYALASGRWRT